MADQTKTPVKTTDTVKVPNKQVNASIPEPVWNDLEGYAYGTRKKLSKLVADILLEFHENNRAEIDAKKVGQ